ncbi:MAG TPA: hypothetical protein VLA04_00105 [Verrucomicrobiae bacterium]|nr:hypothetical protein [Verrucomicrobiae bacterium]
MAKPRLYLFYGNDNRRSQREMQRWVGVFLQKYGETTQYILHADELPHEELLKQLRQALETQSLFASPQLVVVKRLTSGATAARVKEVVSILSRQLSTLSDTVTVVFWEDRHLPPSNALLTWFAEHEEKKQAEVKVFTAGSDRSLVQQALREAGVEAQPEAVRWLERHLMQVERQQRIEGKIRTGDSVLHDHRTWVVQQVVDSAVLLMQGNILSLPDIERAAGMVLDSVSPFEIINAVQAGKWMEARRLARRWEKDDEGAYFGLVALLRNHFKREVGGPRAHFAHYALELLAEIEIMSKNVTLRQAWLLELFCARCSTFNGAHKPLIAPRRLWLSHIQRVD